MREFKVRLAIRTILRRRFETAHTVSCGNPDEALERIRGIYGPRILEILGIHEVEPEPGAPAPRGRRTPGGGKGPARRSPRGRVG